MNQHFGFLLRISSVVPWCFVLLIVSPKGAQAQAWPPPPGQAYVSLAYQFTDVNKHLFSQDVIENGTNLGTKIDLGDIKAQSLQLSIDLGLTGRLALAGNVPYITSKYTGSSAEDAAVDNGSYHGAVQDLSMSARYLVTANPIVITPFVAVNLPTHDYNTMGHSAVGGDLSEFQLGVFVARLLNPVLSNVYVQGGYAYGIFEKHDGMQMKRDYVTFSVGTFVSRALTLGAGGSYQVTHGGIDWTTDIIDESTFEDHDQLAKATFLRLGGSASFNVTRTLSLFGIYSATVSGENTHDGRAITLGLSQVIGIF